MVDKTHIRGRRTRGMGLALFMLISLLTVVALLSGCADAGGPSAQRPEEGRPGGQTRETPAQSDGGEQTPKAGGRLGTPVLGAANAPVVLTEYSDYQ